MGNGIAIIGRIMESEMPFCDEYTRTGVEVDFVVYGESGLFAIEAAAR